MSLKIATLIALIGLIVHFCIVILFMVGVGSIYPIPSVLRGVLSLFSSLIFNGSIILFLAVFYSKQKE